MTKPDHPTRLIANSMPRLAPCLVAAAFALALTGCDQLGIETPAKQAAEVTADGKAVGAACRHAGRAIEDCYALNPKAHKAAVFEGWREMNDYMTKNKIEVVSPQLQSTTRSTSAKRDEVAPAVETADAGASATRTSLPAALNIEVSSKPKPRITAISEADILNARAKAHTP
jgi:hypothetical protein